VGPECGLFLISLGYLDKMVDVSEVNFHVDASFTGRIKEVGNEREGIVILLCYAV